MSVITTADVRAYIAERKAATTVTRRAYDMKQKDRSTRHVPEQERTVAGVSNAEINRELTLLKRMFVLSIQTGRLLHRPHIPLLEERNTRKGFFELEAFASVLAHLPAALRPAIEFPFITGWRITSEVLPLQWRPD